MAPHQAEAGALDSAASNRGEAGRNRSGAAPGTRGRPVRRLVVLPSEPARPSPASGSVLLFPGASGRRKRAIHFSVGVKRAR